jgi:hypothetical protein
MEYVIQLELFSGRGYFKGGQHLDGRYHVFVSASMRDAAVFPERNKGLMKSFINKLEKYKPVAVPLAE